jgi:hypothetical protein
MWDIQKYLRDAEEAAGKPYVRSVLSSGCVLFTLGPVEAAVVANVPSRGAMGNVALEAEDEGQRYPRIAPGEYSACCRWVNTYRNKLYQCWSCLLMFAVLAPDQQRVIAKKVPLWLGLGNREQPTAPPRGEYLKQWMAANGAAPVGGDFPSPEIFVGRIARVEIADSKSPAPYSRVHHIIEWQTGQPVPAA